MPRKLDIDPSLAFTVLLESEAFRKMESRAGSLVINSFLEDWYKSGEKNMWDFGRRWAAETLGEGEGE